MKISTRLYISFFLIIVLTGIIGIVSYSNLQKVANPLENKIQKDINTLTETLELNKLADLIKYYDEVLTMSARNYAFTNDKKWEHRYNSIVPELDKAIKEAIEKGDQEDAKIFESVDAANSALVKMEVEALNKVSEGDKESAIIILESDNYQDQKSIYQNGLNSYFSRRGSQTTSAIQTATIDVKLTTKNTTDLIKSSIRAIFIIFFLTIMSGVGIAYFTFRSISKPIMDTTNVVNEISMGNFTVKIFGMSKLNEINQLTQALNRIIKTMKLAVLEKEPIAKPKGISSQKVSKKNKKKDKIRSRKVDKKLLDEAYNEKALQEKGEKWASDITKKRSNKK